MGKRWQQVVWIIWMVVFISFHFLFIEFAYEQVVAEIWPIVAFLFLIILASLFPIQVRKANIVPLQGISLAVFLQYGLFIEIFITQIGLFTALFSLRLSRKEAYRFPLNSLMFIVVSLLSANVFYLLGGTVGQTSPDVLAENTIPILGYVSISFFTNHVLIYIVRNVFMKIKDPFWDRSMQLETLSFVLIIPVVVSLSLLFYEIGTLAVFLIGIPHVSLSLILRMYNQSEQTNQFLKKASEFGYKVNKGMTKTKIVDMFLDHVTSLFDVEQAYIYERDQKNERLRLLRTYGDDSDRDEVTTRAVDPVINNVFKTRKSKLFTNIPRDKRGFYDPFFYEGVRSVIAVPAVRDQHVVSVILLQTSGKRKYETKDLMVLELMANYLAVATENARIYQEKKSQSERCALTNLYNYRYLENVLRGKDDEDRSQDQEPFSILLIDLDHFKRINDTYGHYSGNEILCQVAEVLQDIVGEKGVVTRYGGEEFVILLEGATLSDGYMLAEKLRVQLENHSFTISDDLSKSSGARTVSLTVSVGVASNETSDTSAMEVLRQADRAMYTGAKQKGRNRVAVYEKSAL
ncbi:sensor domain-containing diguanylate cyclase [Texcoconibacillus texcoconensis]|uniref:Diguanylate cyclase (GGDEF)-like protein n=1 Tax=Texcoconibacillus texcoconensis TaxID=1095777 RepID=A0A840QSB8_9BACI|nr:sensor domain-containing diguanylate cyclase [Texcoconibacillus texcoconensis]MBB5174402.1 diguanylate cyclase (GGDEF)-like protein [Texcoconibacillus texcoconensis]